MKTRILLIALSVVTTYGLMAQGALHDLDFDVQKSDISIVDIDGDGDRDILIIGENPNGKFAQLFQNNGDMGFEKVASPFAGTAITAVNYGDVNGDGLLDVLQSGFGDSVVVNLYTSDAQGVLTLDEYYKELIHIAPSSGIADLNNDGHADIFVFGNHNIEDQRPKLYFGDGAGGFTVESPFDAYKFIDSKATAVDVDNDGDLDLWVMAGYEEGIDARFARLFVNDNGVFTETDPEILAKGPGSSDWGDYDGDGDLDLLIGGWGYVNSGEDNDMIYRIYKNTAGAFTEVAVFSPYGHFSPSDASRFVDWDNDGDLDVVVTGWNPDLGAQQTALFMNSSGTFTAADFNATIPGVSESSVEVADLDADGDLDLVIGGFSGNEFNGEGSALGRNISMVIENTTAGANEAPSAPGNLQVAASGKNVTFSWDEATDDTTPSASLSYNLFLVDADGHHFYYPLADTITGSLIVQEKGNVQLNTSWVVRNLPYGTYRWGVQAIDHSFAGSAFASATLNHTEGGTVLSAGLKKELLLVYPNPGVGALHLHPASDMVSFSVLSMDGRLIRSQTLPAMAPEVQVSLEPGVYLLKARYADGRMTTSKVIVR